MHEALARETQILSTSAKTMRLHPETAGLWSIFNAITVIRVHLLQAG
ncbi:hypothetical protein [Mesorhizobium sp.]